jgi:hypothetical protein
MLAKLIGTGVVSRPLPYERREEESMLTKVENMTAVVPIFPSTGAITGSNGRFDYLIRRNHLDIGGCMSNEENTTKHRDAASKPVGHETNHQCPRRRYAVTSSYQLSLVPPILALELLC